MTIDQPSQFSHSSLRRRLLVGMLGAAAASANRAQAAPAAPLPLAIVDLPPWVLHGSSHRAPGVFVDLARELAQISEVPLAPVAVPYARAVALLCSGDAAMMFSHETTRLKKVADALGPIATEDVVLISHPTRRFTSLSDVRGYVVGHIRGTETHSPFFADPAIIKFEGNSYKQNLAMLLLGRLDAIVAPRTPLRYTMQKMGIARAQLGSTMILGKTSLSLYLSRQHANTDLHLRLDRACQTMQSQRVMEKFIRKYAGQHWL